MAKKREAVEFSYSFETLADYLCAGLDVISIGLNPSLNSVRDGFYFATPQNRFWRALNGSGLVDEPIEPSVAGVERLFHEHGIGFTDVVKRPTNSGSKLRAADYREWSPILHDRLLQFQPQVAWFHGKQAYSNYLRYTQNVRVPSIEWGEQSERIGNSMVFVTPNPSPANAAFSLQVLTEWDQRLKTLLQV
ncbi:hypothetical protein BOW53_11920 [Solemya pervernicosa gill symbiont]|uniref:Uracil-DNA glycosylase-like domain-containing protein n=1 Tax=Solemya pervernicosa gill symbiont TaxID=642797 RepID=A0A1T2L345_9GAMM|nr:mismatch-specific DNA-glycosylase [Solemya pervernicosa gill symbiont]OOZ39356.1 hypothetical protein BOW53_11920 [Solemya pervernicosa gill symbiont]